MKPKIGETWYSPIYEVYVEIVKIHFDEDGVPIYTGENHWRTVRSLFRECELERNVIPITTKDK
jgi:hypothetical protein